MREIEVGGLRITYERAGTGPPLVLLHGYVGDGPATWRPQLDGLRDDFTLVAWNAPGSGGSSDPPESFGMAGYADALAGFIAGLGLGTPHVAGISFGGALALALYRRHPSVPRMLVLASAYAGWGGSLPAEVADQRLRQAPRPGRPVPRRVRRRSPPDDVLRGDPEGIRRGVRGQHARLPPGRLPRHGQRLGREPPRRPPPHRGPDPARLRRRGRPSPPLGGQGPRSLDPASTLVVLPDAGHVCNIEAPKKFNTAVRSFLLGTLSP